MAPYCIQKIKKVKVKYREDKNHSNKLGASGSCLLDTQEAEIRRIPVQSQPRQDSLQEPISKKKKKNHKKGLVEWLKV
jgi:hypothetical protein